MIDLEDLRRKAEAAKPGPWSVFTDVRGDRHGEDTIEYVAGFNIESDAGDVVGIEGILADQRADAEFIAAANPATILALIAEIDRCHARLEIDHVYRVVDGETVREDVAYADRGNVPDGIECRDATIRFVLERIAELEAKFNPPR